MQSGAHQTGAGLERLVLVVGMPSIFASVPERTAVSPRVCSELVIDYCCARALKDQGY